MKIRYVFGFLLLVVTILSSVSSFSAYGDENDLDGSDDYISPYDFDSDGLPDAIDACIDFPEVYNKYQDEDGCPDEVPVGQ